MVRSEETTAMSPDGNDDEPFLSRWSRAKRSSVRPTVAPEKSSVEQPVVAEIDPATLPNVDDLTAESDITGFLQKGVPEALQRLALRRVWALDPGIRDFVEVAENQWDFNAVGGIPGLYQDIAPGTDIGVWLAQATQSVVVDPKAPAGEPAMAVAAANGRADDAAVQHAVTSGQQGRVATDEPTTDSYDSDRPLPKSSSQATAPDRELVASAKIPPAPFHRRHGSALPE
jgi:Protein of unknown function (DUF3306)